MMRTGLVTPTATAAGAHALAVSLPLPPFASCCTLLWKEAWSTPRTSTDASSFHPTHGGFFNHRVVTVFINRTKVSDKSVLDLFLCSF